MCRNTILPRKKNALSCFFYLEQEITTNFRVGLFKKKKNQIDKAEACLPLFHLLCDVKKVGFQSNTLTIILAEAEKCDAVM